MTIDENELSPAHKILSTTKLKSKQKQPPHNNRSKWLLLKASWNLSKGHMSCTSIVRMVLAIVQWALSNVEFSCGFLEIIGF